jgi:hypothetical protein
LAPTPTVLSKMPLTLLHPSETLSKENVFLTKKVYSSSVFWNFTVIGR